MAAILPLRMRHRTNQVGAGPDALAGLDARSRGLHALTAQIKLLELEMEIELQVVHVPGKAMIQQGTDGLSRGVWMSELHPCVDQQSLTASIFAPIPIQPHLITYFTQMVGWDIHELKDSPWEHPLEGEELMHQLTYHFPPPEMARQTIIGFLEAWVESPRDTGAMFFIPRVIPLFWHGLSRHVEELGLVDAASIAPPPLLPIPVLVLCVKPHTPVLSTTRPPEHPNRSSIHRSWRHRQEAETVRSLQPIHLPPGY